VASPMTSRSPAVAAIAVSPYVDATGRGDPRSVMSIGGWG
jgi:hypothetical protein